MKLINTKITPKKEDSMVMETAPSKKQKPFYPWGLKINLEKEILKKLNLKPSNFKIGQKVSIEAIGEVNLISQREEGDGYNSSEVSIQIIDFGIVSGKESKFKEYKEENEKGPGE